ncbi:MAG: hypothetical protein HON46_04885 [Gammaproteobacteria bacterium]|jgi:uncharacterized protein YcfL|nr:hypothetical protein [Gammaproteobacteria bacterium]MBT6835947.1 hypothetical protein [Bacteroidota bacterium]
MKKFQLFVIPLLLLLSSGCGTYKQTVQVDDQAYLLLIGNPIGSIVTIDEGKPINLSQETVSYNINGQKATKIKISIGTHTVKVTKGGNITVKRNFYVSTGNSFEVQL